MACPFLILNFIFVVGYYNELTVVQRLLLVKKFKDNLVNNFILLLINCLSMFLTLNILSNFKLNFDCTEVLFFKIK